MNEEQIYQNLKEFKEKHGYLLHPKCGEGKMSLEAWAKLIASIQCCPCDPDRPNCPCDKAEDEIKKQGFCKCRMFYRPDCEERKTWK